MYVKTILSFLYVLRTAVDTAEGSQQHYEETGTYILVNFSRLNRSSMLGGVTEHAAGLNLCHLY
jgi:hypothetical protein